MGEEIHGETNLCRLDILTRPDIIVMITQTQRHATPHRAVPREYMRRNLIRISPLQPASTSTIVSVFPLFVVNLEY